MTTIGGRLVPALLTKDMAATLDFHQRLGFQLTACDKDRATANWAEVRRDDVTFQFHTELPHGTPREPVCSGTFYVFPTNVGELAREYAAAGVPFAWGPEVMEYGMNEFAVQDPNGYFIAFTEPESATPGRLV